MLIDNIFIERLGLSLFCKWLWVVWHYMETFLHLFESLNNFYYLFANRLWCTKNDNYVFLYSSISGHFLTSYVFIFHKTFWMVILVCLTGINSDWFKKHDTKCKYFHFPFFSFFFFAILYKNTHTFVFFCVFAVCVIIFGPIKI